MTSGLVHLVAPKAKILPLKAFSSNGTGNLSNIVAGHLLRRAAQRERRQHELRPYLFFASAISGDFLRQ